MNRIVSGVMFALLLMGTLVFAFDVQPVRASATIYIRSTGAVDPSTATIRRTGSIYTFTNNITDSIVLEKDNVVIVGAGYWLQGPETSDSKGFSLFGRKNVTIMNTAIKGFGYGIYLSGCSNIILDGNAVEGFITGDPPLYTFNNGVGIYLESSNTSVHRNVLSGAYTGIEVHGIFNSISENTIKGNDRGIILDGNSTNIFGNNIGPNAGSWASHPYSYNLIISSHHNRIYHNNFLSVDEIHDVGSDNSWDEGYPSGGNYWSAYTGADSKSGPNQDQPGSDGIGDTAYVFYFLEQIDLPQLTDHYPLVKSVPAWADIYIQHNYTGDLVVTLGVGNPNSPSWQRVVWNKQGGGKHDLSLNVVLSDAASYLPASETKRWFLKVYDEYPTTAAGFVREFSISYGSQDVFTTTASADTPLYTYDRYTVYAYLPSTASAHVVIEHTSRIDLIVDVGVGNVSNPYWSTRIWNGGGGQGVIPQLDLKVDLFGALSRLPPTQTNTWFLKVYDKYTGDQGRILSFTITYRGATYASTDVPVLITDFKTSYAYISSQMPSVATIFIEHTWVGDLNVTLGCGNPSSSQWSRLIWNRAGGSQKNLSLTVDLSAATAYLPPSNTYVWYLKVYDAASGDTGRIVSFSITYQGKTYSSTSVPVAINDLKTSYAYIPSTAASAHIYVEHTYRGDLVVDIGVGNTASPFWSSRVWNRQGGSADNLDLTVDLSAATAYLPPSNTYRWFLKVYDAAAGDQGRITQFTITYQGKTNSSTDVPVPVTDLKTSYAYIPTPVSAQAHVYIQHTYQGDLIVDIGVGSTSSPLWIKRVWNGTGGSADNLDLYIDLSTVTKYLPPSTTYTWWVKVYDKAAGDTGSIITFTIAYQGKTYTSPNVPVSISDLKTSYAYIKG